MAVFREGKVTEITAATPSAIRLRVSLGTDTIDAVAYPAMSGPVGEGDRVIVNTTGIELQLGTGGVGFVLWNLDGDRPMELDEGHIMKLRYTPWQLNVLAAEAPESPHHETMVEAVDLDGIPVVACGLHSQLPGVAAGIRAAHPDARIGYLMTDGGALPLGFSTLVGQLREGGLLDMTCTAGHAFGGDLEAVNVFSGLLALRHAGDCDAVVAGMGPGSVGTGTPFGYSALEQGQLLDAASGLGGLAIAALRISFDDPRERHRGISHHTLTALRVAARERCLIAVPKLSPEASRRIADQLGDSGVCDVHDTRVADGRPGVRLLEERGLQPTSMGRKMTESPELWLAAAAAGALAAEALMGGG